MAKIFITGGMGYLGSALAREAAKMGHEICLYDSLIYEQDTARMLKEIGRVKLVIGDTRNRGLLTASLKEFKPDFVVHFAELSSVYACEHNPTLTEEINYKASMWIIDICESLDIPVLYNSSSSIYGDKDNYTRHKLKMEEYVKGKNVVVFRPATVFGISPRMRMELFPNHFTYMALKGKITISRPNDYRTAIDINDLIAGYLGVIEKGSWKQQTYDVGHFNLTKQEYAQEISEVILCEIVITSKEYDNRNIKINSSDFNKEFHKPMISYKESIKRIARWLNDNLDRLENTNFIEVLNMPVVNWKQICSQRN